MCDAGSGGSDSSGSYMEVGLATLIVIVLCVLCHDMKHMRSPQNADVGGLVEVGGSRMFGRPQKKLCAAREPAPILVAASPVDEALRRGGEDAASGNLCGKP